MKMINRKCIQTIFLDVRGYFEISVFEIDIIDSQLCNVASPFVLFSAWNTGCQW